MHVLDYIHVHVHMYVLYIYNDLFIDVQDTVYEYHVDPKTKNWVLWEDGLKSGWRYPSKYVLNKYTFT